MMSFYLTSRYDTASILAAPKMCRSSVFFILSNQINLLIFTLLFTGEMFHILCWPLEIDYTVRT